MSEAFYNLSLRMCRLEFMQYNNINDIDEYMECLQNRIDEYKTYSYDILYVGSEYSYISDIISELRLKNKASQYQNENNVEKFQKALTYKIEYLQTLMEYLNILFKDKRSTKHILKSLKESYEKLCNARYIYDSWIKQL